LYNEKGDYKNEEVAGNALINTEGVILKDTVINGICILLREFRTAMLPLTV